MFLEIALVPWPHQSQSLIWTPFQCPSPLQLATSSNLAAAQSSWSDEVHLLLWKEHSVAFQVFVAGDGAEAYPGEVRCLRRAASRCCGGDGKPSCGLPLWLVGSGLRTCPGYGIEAVFRDFSPCLLCLARFSFVWRKECYVSLTVLCMNCRSCIGRNRLRWGRSPFESLKSDW